MTIRVLALLATAGSCLWADEFGRGEQNTVTICLERNGAGNLSYASSLVSRMYAAIDVQINWRPARNCPASVSTACRVSPYVRTRPSAAYRAGESACMPAAARKASRTDCQGRIMNPNPVVEPRCRES